VDLNSPAFALNKSSSILVVQLASLKRAKSKIMLREDRATTNYSD
jgi:hypothetical protein